MRFIKNGSIKKKIVLLMLAAIISTGTIAFGQNDSVEVEKHKFENFRVSASEKRLLDEPDSRAHTGDSVVTISSGLGSSLVDSMSTVYAAVYKEQTKQVTTTKTIKILGKYNLEYQPAGVYWLGEGYYLGLQVDKYSRTTVVTLSGVFEP